MALDLVSELRKVKPLPSISYIALVLSGGFALDSLTGWGKHAYLALAIYWPIVSVCIDQVSDTQLSEKVMREWGRSPRELHSMAILDAVILLCFGSQNNKLHGKQ